MPSTRAMIAVLMALWLTGPAALAQDDKLSLHAVSIHLFLEKSGEFSHDITQAPGVGAWNFRPISGDVDSDESFHSYLIKVTFRSGGEAYAEGEQATLVISEVESGTVLVTETIRDVYIGPSGQVTKPFLIHDQVCGPLRVDVSDDEKTITNRLQFACGE